MEMKLTIRCLQSTGKYRVGELYSVSPDRARACTESGEFELVRSPAVERAVHIPDREKAVITPRRKKAKRTK